MPTEFWTAIGVVAAAFFGSSWIGEIIKGKFSNKNIDEKLSAIQQQMEDNDKNLNKRIDELNDKVDENDAVNRRYRVVRLSRESRSRTLDEDELNTAIEDIHVYEDFCKKHERYENGKASRAIANIRYLDRTRRERTFEKVN